MRFGLLGEKLRFVVSGRTQSQARQVLEFDNKIYNPFERDTLDRQPYAADLYSEWRALGFQSSLERSRLPTFLYLWSPDPTLERLGGK